MEKVIPQLKDICPECNGEGVVIPQVTAYSNERELCPCCKGNKIVEIKAGRSLSWVSRQQNNEKRMCTQTSGGK